jgi:hypothetical protein
MLLSWCVNKAVYGKLQAIKHFFEILNCCLVHLTTFFPWRICVEL